jgi:hypothetical protein
MRRCSTCGSEFQDWVTTCLDCGNALKNNQDRAEAIEIKELPVEDPEVPDRVKVMRPGQPAETEAKAKTNRKQQTEEEETVEDELELPGEIDEQDDSLADYVDEVVQDSDFVNPDALDDYGEKIEVNPRANLASVVQSEFEDTIKKAAVVLSNSGIKLYMLKKAGVLNFYYVLMVEIQDEEKANRILEETDGGNLEPSDPDVEDPELKGAPVINLDEIEAQAKAKTVLRKPEPAGKDEDTPLVCPNCDSKNIEAKHSFFSSKTKLRCRACKNTWTLE